MTGSFDDVAKSLDRIRPAMQADGGDAELVSVEEGVAYVRLRGACLVCPSSRLTLKQGIEKSLQQELPWVREVVRVA